MQQAALAAREHAPDETIAPVPFPTPEQKAALKSSFMALEPALGLVATLFFRRLDEIAPEVRALLPGGEKEQKRQLLTSLALAVAALDRFHDIHPPLRLLGARFRELGASEFHYGAVGEALTWTLQHSLGAHCTPQVADAWTAFCAEIAEIMSGAHRA